MLGHVDIVVVHVQAAGVPAGRTAGAAAGTPPLPGSTPPTPPAADAGAGNEVSAPGACLAMQQRRALPWQQTTMLTDVAMHSVAHMDPACMHVQGACCGGRPWKLTASAVPSAPGTHLRAWCVQLGAANSHICSQQHRRSCSRTQASVSGALPGTDARHLPPCRAARLIGC